MLRIGEVARIAGVSTRAVRHYHAVGVLPEPERRSNGYREYSGRDLLLLVRVVRLAGLGLTLDEIRDALAEETGRELRDILADLVADLDAQAAEITRRRRQLAEVLGREENLTASPAVASMISRLSTVVDNPVQLRREQEILEVAEATMSADRFSQLSETYHEMVSDPEIVAATHEFADRFERLTSQDPDDPEVQAVTALLIKNGGRFAVPAPAAREDSTGWELFLQSLTPAQRHAVTAAARHWS